LERKGKGKGKQGGEIGGNVSASGQIDRVIHVDDPKYRPSPPQRLTVIFVFIYYLVLVLVLILETFSNFSVVISSS